MRLGFAIAIESFRCDYLILSSRGLLTSSRSPYNSPSIPFLVVELPMTEHICTNEDPKGLRNMEICEHGSTDLERPSTHLSQGYEPLGLSSTEKVDIAVEVCLKSKTTVRHDEIRVAVERMLDKRSLIYEDGPIPICQLDEPFLFEHVENITICDTGGQTHSNGVLLFWQVTLKVYVYQLNEEGPGEEIDGNNSIASFHEWMLPAREFHGLWESLTYESGIKQQLLQYAATALLFSDKGVNPNLISLNRVILLHGPPGTGKTSICRALGQKLAIRFSNRYPQSQLLEVNAHSLFSKWFSESGKLVTKLFQKIQEIVEDGTTLVFVLIDEVESLTAARQAALSGSEPSDSIRVVNALLTQLDLLKSWPNVVVLTTSNITAAIDVAFVDRADIKAYIGPPSLQARYEILKSCLIELRRVGIINPSMADETELLSFKVLLQKSTDCTRDHQRGELSLEWSRMLLTIAEACEGFSGRSLRKLPFLAHATAATPLKCDYTTFMTAVHEAVKTELLQRACL